MIMVKTSEDSGGAAGHYSPWIQPVTLMMNTSVLSIAGGDGASEKPLSPSRHANAAHYQACLVRRRWDVPAAIKS